MLTTRGSASSVHNMASDQKDALKHQVEVELIESQQQNGESNMKQDPTEPAECQEPQQQQNYLDHNQKSQSYCAGCSGPIRDKFIFSVIDLYWHQGCVKCTDCTQSLNERCYTYEGKLYCRQDYWHRFGPKCYACNESIDQSELVQRIKGDRIYHLKCFTCNECHRQLQQGEQLHLIDDKKLICRQDFKRINHTTLSNVSNGDTTNTATTNNNGFSGHETQSSYFTLLGSSSMPSSKPLIESLKHRSSLTSLDNMNLNKDGEDVDMAAGDVDLDSVDERDNNNHHLEDEENRLAGVDLIGADPHDPTSVAGDASLNLPNTKITSTAATTVTTKQSQANAIKRKRRRKQRLMAGVEVKQSGKLQGGAREGNKTTQASKLLMANRSGKSILNGGPGATTILAQEKMAGTIGQHHHHQHQDQHVSCSSSSSSSTTSTSSSHSNSSNSTSSQRQQDGGTSTQHHHNHHQNNHHQQQNHHHLHHHHHHHHQSTGGGGGGGGGGNGGNGGAGGGGHKPTRVRTVLNEKQLQTLRDCYANNPRPDALMKEQLVDMTGLSSRVIRVWFQNKRCKDKKKSILYKQMQQHEKDGRHLAGLTHIRGVPMVAASPIHYQDEHSSAATVTPPPNANSNEPDQSGAVASVQSPGQLIKQQQAGAAAAAADNAQGHQAIDIHAYQPPWKSLADYAQQSDTSGGGPIDPASPHYQQLIGQIHGYAPTEHQVGAEPQQQQQQYGVAVPPPRPPTSTGGEPGPYPPPPLPPHSGLMQPPPPIPAHHHHHHTHHLGHPAPLMAAPMDSGGGGLHMHQFQH